jgi:recombination DNA repair RAD52 pathway protein
VTGFNAQQTLQLLQPIHQSRVVLDGKGHPHVSQQDITAHLIRIFGFGNFDLDIIETRCLFETNAIDKQTNEPKPDRFDVCYLAKVRLTIRNAEGDIVCHYEDGSTATAQNQTRGDAHDLAFKSALSLAKKRAAVYLGDQFGLSLYNKGQMRALVKGTLVLPAVEEDADEDQIDVQDDIEQQVSLGDREEAFEEAP